MTNNCIFTICSKNYLAQALTLKESAHKQEPNVDFYIFLADKKTEEIDGVEVEELDESWIPNWREMAFKYNVIEFNTSIKPFCIKKLFNKGYKKVAYLDPDTYVTSKLDYIWDNLDKYSVILTPHVNNIETDYTGGVPQTELLFVGIYNLGFGAFGNNEIGNKVVEWWCSRLYEACYADNYSALHVDQRWMDFIPGFYPKDTLISHQFGLNVAVWNLHERELIIEDDRYMIKDLASKLEFPLLLFHFSGFDPFNDAVINRRHPRFGVDSCPSFKPIIQEYKEAEYRNGYDKYSKLSYAFNEYDNGYVIMPLHRRLFRSCIEEFRGNNPFSEDGIFYRKLEAAKLILKQKNTGAMYRQESFKGSKRSSSEKIIKRALVILKNLIGVKRYDMFITYVGTLLRNENQRFLMGKMEKIDKDELFNYRNM